jgi:hypothetical protein
MIKPTCTADHGTEPPSQHNLQDKQQNVVSIRASASVTNNNNQIAVYECYTMSMDYK